MTRHITSVVVAVLGLALLVVASGSNAVRLVESDLSGLTGGQVEFCKKLGPPVPTDCNICLPDGNGGSIKCDNDPVGGCHWRRLWAASAVES